MIPTWIQRKTPVLDVLIGIVLLIIGILAATGKISLTQGQIYAVLGVGAFQLAPCIGGLLRAVMHTLMHYKFQRAQRV